MFTVGLACATELAMTPHLSANNLTLVSDLFYDDCGKMDTVEPPVINDHLKYNRGLCVSLNRCRAKMAGIRRNTKQLVLSNGQLLPYDILLLATGSFFRFLRFSKNQQFSENCHFSGNQQDKVDLI